MRRGHRCPNRRLPRPTRRSTRWRAAAGAASRRARPEIVEVEPVVRRLARVVLDPARVSDDSLPRAPLALRARKPFHVGEVGERREADLVAIAAAIKAGDED